SNLLKIQYAQKLIKETSLTIAEIAQEIGIDDPYYFSKLFKNKTGLTPTQYKNEIDYRELE
ncbi:MAG TPA: DNA-binding response regulator, partial [Firmicutes bacterium]|nr:DNA-binding response regulator [Bacillota bacterium]